MFVDPDKPLPLPGEKKDGIGVVLEGIIEITNARINATGDASQYEELIKQEEADATAKINQMFSEVDGA